MAHVTILYLRHTLERASGTLPLYTSGIQGGILWLLELTRLDYPLQRYMSNYYRLSRMCVRRMFVSSIDKVEIGRIGI